MFYTRFLSPADHKCAGSSTYWQFFYYRPPGKFRWTSVNHFDKQREISLKCDAKNLSLSLSLSFSLSLSIYIYMYMYHTLDNRFLKILVVIVHVSIYWSKVPRVFRCSTPSCYVIYSLHDVLQHSTSFLLQPASASFYSHMKWITLYLHMSRCVDIIFA